MEGRMVRLKTEGFLIQHTLSEALGFKNIQLKDNIQSTEVGMSVEHTTYTAKKNQAQNLIPVQMNHFSSVIKRTVGDIRLRSLNITLGRKTNRCIINLKEVEINAF